MNKLVIAFVAGVAAVCCATSCFAQDAEAANAEGAAAEAPKKRPPKKLPEYKLWEQAATAAEAWEQPIFAFIGVQGDKLTSRARTVFINNPACKEFIAKNVIFYTYSIPQAKSKNPRGGKPDKDAPAKPDNSAIKESERTMISRIVGSSGHGTAIYPVMAIVTPLGRTLYKYVPDPENLTLAHFINNIKEAFERDKISFEMTSKMKKALADEEKKRLAAEKQAKKK